MGDRPLDEKAIFHAACRVKPPEARGDYLKQACGDDAALIERVVALLRVHDEEPSFLESPPHALVATAAPTIDQPIAERPGTKIVRHKLLQGECGMGSVFMATHKELVRRKVALKVIKSMMCTASCEGRSASQRRF